MTLDLNKNYSQFIDLSRPKSCAIFFKWNKKCFHFYCVKIKEFATDPYFLHLSQNMTTDCLLIHVFLRVAQHLKSRQEQVKTRKSTNNWPSSLGLTQRWGIKKNLWNQWKSIGPASVSRIFFRCLIYEWRVKISQRPECTILHLDLWDIFNL